MSEFRKPSIIDTITPLQGLAWEAEHTALEVEKSGFGAFKSYHLEAAKDLRRTDLRNKIQELFDRSDAQNAIIDGALEAKANGHAIPLLTPMEPQVDYSLMEQ